MNLSMRKFFLIILVTGMLGCFYWIFDPVRAEQAVHSAAEAVYNAWYQKELLIAGDSSLSDKAIRDLLPAEMSTLWWLMNTDIIEGELRKSPWILRARIHPCATGVLSLWGCFVVSIEERKPSFLLTEGDITWLVGEDGGFISPLTPRLRELFKDRTLRTLKGFYDDSPSAELFHARFKYATDAMEIIEKRLKKKISSVQLMPQGELEVNFEDNPFAVVFSGGLDTAEPLHFELDRLQVLLDQFQGKEDTIQKIDLAFSKLAVVKFKDGMVQTGTPQ